MTTYPHKVALWGPLPPAPGNTADYGYRLLAALQPHFSVVAVVPDRDVADAIAPDGVVVLGVSEATQGHIGAPDVHIYQLGADRSQHSWLLAPLRQHPGIVVLHDVSLFDLYRSVCSGSPALWEHEIAAQGYDRALAHTVESDDGPVPDPLAYTFTNAVASSSLCTVVHSPWAVDYLTTLHPGARIAYIPYGADWTAPAPTGTSPVKSGGITVLGAGRHRRLDVSLAAFAQVAADHGRARLCVTGPLSDSQHDDLRSRVATLGLQNKVRLVPDPSTSDIERAIVESRLVVALHWPTAGGMIGEVVRSLGRGRPVLASDLPQFAHFDESYVSRVRPYATDELDVVAGAMRAALERPDEASAKGRMGAQLVEANHSWEHTAAQFAQLINEHIASGRSTPLVSEAAPSSTTAGYSTDLTVHGDWTATTGLAHAGRRLALALLRNGTPMSVTNVSTPAPKNSSLYPAEFVGLESTVPSAVNLWILNINEFGAVPDAVLHTRRTRRYHIASWYWELPTLPDWLPEQLERVDEVWAPTHFVQRAFLRYTDTPVHIVPSVVPTFVPTTTDRDALRTRLGLPIGRVMFLFTFDFNSTIGRKNPAGVIDAFSRAFSPREREGEVLLVLKAINLDVNPDYQAALHAAVDKVGGLLIDGHMSGDAMADLFHACDVYVSLHRSEGFGFGMAEAMAIGKPVIGTAFSGNVDFMKANNSCPVGYRLRAVDASDTQHNQHMEKIYTVGSLWAEPDVDQAVHWMQLLASDETLRADIGAAGKVTISENFSEAAVGRIANARLTALAQELGLGPYDAPPHPSGYQPEWPMQRWPAGATRG